jgi:3-ketosteroid 9alpha-monooxygenase subunit A
VALFEQDIPIWEHKTYRTQPLLCNGDGPIGAYRKWANQFYEIGN